MFDINLRLERSITAIADPNQHKPKQIFTSNSTSPRFDTWLENALVTISPSADIILFAGRNSQVLLSKLKRDSVNEYTNKQLNIPLEYDEQITSLLLLPMMATQRTSIGSIDWTALVFGLSSGYVKFYTERATCLLSLRFCEEPIVSLKCQTMKTETNAQSEAHFAIISDEMLIAHKTCIFIIDGICLHENLKKAKNDTIQEISEYEPAYSLENLPTILNCKKWRVDSFHRSQITDAELLGTRNIPNFDNLLASSMNYDRVPSKNYSNTVAFVGQNPFASCYRETVESSSNSYTEILGSLMSMWNKPPPSKAKILEPVPNSSLLFDHDRLATSIVASPDRRLLAITDDFGRVMMVDSTNWIVIRMWKGYRSAQCGWIQVKQNPEKRESPTATFLVIHAPKRDLVEIWSAQKGPRVAGFNVGKGCRLLYNGYKMFNMRAELGQKSSCIPLIEQCYNNNCYLLDPKSERVFAIEVPYTYSLFKFSDLKFRDILILRELSTAIDQDVETSQILSIVHRLALADSCQEAIEKLASGLLPEKVSAILGNIINKTMMNYDNNVGGTMSDDDKSIVELCKRVIRLCQIFIDLSKQHKQQYKIPDMNRRLIDEFEEHPGELDKFATSLGWSATEVLRYLSLLSLERSYSSDPTSLSTPWPNLGEPLAWTEFLSCFDLTRICDKKRVSIDTPSNDTKESHTASKLTNHKLKLSSNIKSMSEDRIIKTSLFLFSNMSEQFYKEFSLSSDSKEEEEGSEDQDNIEGQEIHLSSKHSDQSSCDIYKFFDPATCLALIFQFWLNTSLCNYWRMWPFLKQQVRLASEELKVLTRETDNEAAFIECWTQIVSLIVNTENLFAAIISTAVIKADTLELIDLSPSKSASIDTSKEDDDQTDQTLDASVNSPSVTTKPVDWECLCMDAERMSLLNQQLECLFLLNLLLKYSRKNESVNLRLYKVPKVTVSSIQLKGPTIVSELVAIWALQSNIALINLIQNFGGRELVTSISEKDKLISEQKEDEARLNAIAKGRQIVGYRAPIQVLVADEASEEEHVKELIHHTRNLFPCSLKPDIILINYYWVSCQIWLRNPVVANEETLLDKSYDSLVLISSSYLRYRLACLSCKTFFQWPLTRLSELIRNNPMIFNYQQQNISGIEITKKSGTSSGKSKANSKALATRDSILRKELNMNEDCVNGFVQFCCDISELILQIHTEISDDVIKQDNDEDTFRAKAEEELAVTLLTFDDWWSMPSICKNVPQTNSLESLSSSKYKLKDNEVYRKSQSHPTETNQKSEVSNSINKILLSSSSLMSIDSIVEFNTTCKNLKSILKPNAVVG